ncbi:MAG: methyltransferase domain-containing protein [Acidimicrobiia bacterium]
MSAPHETEAWSLAARPTASSTEVGGALGDPIPAYRGPSVGTVGLSDPWVGQGEEWAAFADRGHRVVAVDRWPRMATIARRNPQLQTVAVADATRPPLRGHALADRPGGGCDSGQK